MEPEKNNTPPDHQLENPDGEHMLETPTASSQSSSVSTEQPKKSLFSKLKTKTALLVTGAVVLVLGASAGAYFGYYLPNQPEYVLKQAFIKTFSEEGMSQSGRFDGTLKVSGEGIPEGFNTLNFSGSSDGGSGVTFEVDLNAFLAKLKLELLSVEENVVYLKLSGLDSLGALLPGLLGLSETSDDSTQALEEGLNSLVKALDDQWYSIDTSIFSAFGGPSTQSINLDSLASTYRNYAAVESVEKLADEEVAGQTSQHFKVTLDSEATKQFIMEIVRQNQTALAIEDQAQLDELKKELDKVDFSKYPFDVWVGADGYINQLAIALSEQGTSVEFKVTLKDRGAQITITKPEDAKPVTDLLDQLEPLNSLLGGGFEQDSELDSSEDFFNL